LSTLPRRIALAVWRPIERRAAGAYLAGPKLSDALDAGARIVERGYGLVLGFSNADGDDPEAVAAENLAAIEAMGPLRRDWHLSVKAPALHYSTELLGPIAEASAKAGVFLHFDSHAPDTADATLALAAEASKVHHDVGITIPGRWRRSLGDAELAVELGLRVRIVKGEWPDPDEPHLDMREGFLAVVDQLAGRGRHASLASHDAPLAHAAALRLAAGGTPHDLELLLGLPFEPVVEVARADSLPARVYVPYGHASLRYGLGYLRRNPRRIKWLARDLVLRRRRTVPPPL
jgi:proline dehydrogenase